MKTKTLKMIANDKQLNRLLTAFYKYRSVESFDHLADYALVEFNMYILEGDLDGELVFVSSTDLRARFPAVLVSHPLNYTRYDGEAFRSKELFSLEVVPKGVIDTNELFGGFYTSNDDYP